MEDKLKKLLAVLLGINVDQIDENASTETINGWDSLKQMNIVVAIEEEFEIQFSEEESILSDSYKSLIDLIRSNENTNSNG